MSDRELRLQCAKLAAELVGTAGPEEVQKVASRLYEWVTTSKA
jgi:hypothetical protein